MQYVDENPGYWIVIGSGYSTAGKRWETVSINGYMVFNNGVDLLCTYRVEEMSVVPIYELREQGVAAVGTISEINGILMCGDITEIHPHEVPLWFNTAGKLTLDSLTFDIPTMKAEATRAAGHPYVVGQAVTISGALAPDYDGVHVISDITATTFKYPSSAPHQRLQIPQSESRLSPLRTRRPTGSIRMWLISTELRSGCFGGSQVNRDVGEPSSQDRSTPGRTS